MEKELAADRSWAVVRNTSAARKEYSSEAA